MSSDIILESQKQAILAYKPHPIASMFPRMDSFSFADLKADIAKHGVIEAVTLFEGQVLDGRHRLEAAQQLAKEGVIVSLPTAEFAGDKADAYTFVASANLHRRHLSAQDRRAVAEHLLRINASFSDRQIAATAKLSPTTVGSVRKEMEERGEVSKLDTRTDKRGAERPSTQPSPKPKPQPKPLADPEPKPVSVPDKAAWADSPAPAPEPETDPLAQFFAGADPTPEQPEASTGEGEDEEANWKIYVYDDLKDAELAMIFAVKRFEVTNDAEESLYFEMEVTLSKIQGLIESLKSLPEEEQNDEEGVAEDADLSPEIEAVLEQAGDQAKQALEAFSPESIRGLKVGQQAWWETGAGGKRSRMTGQIVGFFGGFAQMVTEEGNRVDVGENALYIMEPLCAACGVNEANEGAKYCFDCDPVCDTVMDSDIEDRGEGALFGASAGKPTNGSMLDAFLR